MTRSNLFFFGSIFSVLAASMAFASVMRYRDENRLLVCVSPPFPVGNCDDIVAEPGDRIFLNEIAQVPATGPVVQNYWAEVNGRQVPVEVLIDDRNGVSLYTTVPEPEPFSSNRSPLSRSQQLFQDCINVGGRLYGLDQDGDGFLPLLGNSTGDTNTYPCVVSGHLSPPYAMPATAKDIDNDRDDTNPNIH